MLNRFRQYLTNKGLRYEVHEPNVITFDYSSHTYMFEYTHPNYIRLMLPSFENCNSFDAAKWVTISELNATYKVAKIVKNTNSLWISFETFVYGDDMLSPLFDTMLNIVENMYHEYLRR